MLMMLVRTRLKSSSTVAPQAGIERIFARCRFEYAVGLVVDEFFLTVPGINFVMCIISTRRHVLFTSQIPYTLPTLFLKKIVSTLIHVLVPYIYLHVVRDLGKCDGSPRRWSNVPTLYAIIGAYTSSSRLSDS